LEPYLGRLAHELTTSRTYHLFLNRLRWLALSKHQTLRNAMGDTTLTAHRHVTGGIGDVFAAQSASASAQRRSARGLRLHGPDSDVAALVRLSVPLNSPEFGVHKPWCLLLTLRYQLEYAGRETDAEQLDVFYKSHRCFETRFLAQLQQGCAMLVDEAHLSGSHQAETNMIIVRTSEWKKDNTILPQQDARQEQRTAHLQTLQCALDELLGAESAFAARDDMDYAMLRLRQRAGTTAKPARVKTLQVSAYQRGETFSGGMWTDMYGQQQQPAAMAMPTLDEEEEDAAMPVSDRAVHKNGFLATLYLRHIHVRDLKIQALSWLNYFRSVERRVHHDMRMLSAAEDLRHDRDALVACLQEHEEGFEHDRYTLTDSLVQVQDSELRTVRYDCVDDDFRALEQELLALGTHYLQRLAKTESQGNDTGQGHARTRRPRPTSSRPASRAAAKDGRLRENAAFDLSMFGQGAVDRGAVLLDLWLWEVGFLHEKQRLLACILTAYELTVDAGQRQQLLQSMVDLLYRRPLYDLEADYFASSYHMDTQGIRLQRQLYLDIIAHLVDQHRQTTSSMADKPSGIYPSSQYSTNPSSLHDLEPQQALGHVQVQLLEFVDSMGVIATLDKALAFAVNEAKRIHQPASLSEYTRLRVAVIAHALDAWTDEATLGGYAKEMDDDLRQLLEENVLDQSSLLIRTTRTVAVQACQTATERGGNDQVVQGAGTRVLGMALELVTLRHRLLLLCHEGIVLTKLYRGCCASLKLGEHHACLRPMTFATAGSSKIEV
jgi:hypothetical protein